MFLPGCAGTEQDFLFSIFFFFHKGDVSSVAESHRSSAGLKAILSCGPALTPFTSPSFSDKSVERHQKLSPVPFWVQEKFLSGVVCDFMLGWTQTWEQKSPFSGDQVIHKRNRTVTRKLARTEQNRERIQKSWEEIEIINRRYKAAEETRGRTNEDVGQQEKTMNRRWKRGAG